MNPVQAFLVGIAPNHIPALVAAMLLPVFVYFSRRLRRGPAGAAAATESGEDIGAVRRWAAWLLGLAAAVHLALPLGHGDNLPLALAFLGGGVAYAWLALRAWEGRTWRLWSALLIVATLVAYLVALANEEPDQVGIATAMVELTALGLALVPVRDLVRKRRFKRMLASSATLLATFVVGIGVWVGSFAAHAAADSDVSAAEAADAATEPGSAALAVEHGGDHEHSGAARAQAGVISRPQTQLSATAAQQRAAGELAAATAAATSRYATSLDAALADGYELPKPGVGMDVHMQNKAYASDGRVLDPARPELLVYAIEGGRATLLGVVFVMERAGQPGPQPGGPITNWHAHNICLTLLPPGFGIVTPFGNCPALALNLTSPEMMHVWVVDNPQGAYADGLDANWVRDYHARHGTAYRSG